jgi:multimeric flavodoxin WrbA
VHFLVIVASARRRGNSDLLGHLALRQAFKHDIDSGEIVYLKDFELQQCRGCLTCLKEDQKCPLEDDLYRLLGIIQDAGKLLLIAPVYVLTIPGTLKLLLDRYLAISQYLNAQTTGHAASIGVAALADWHQFQQPLMNLLLLALGRRVVSSAVVYGAGPGEVLLNDSVAAVQSTVTELIDHKDEPYESVTQDYCPIDRSRMFEHVDGDKFRCPICLTPATLSKEGYRFRAEDLNNHRWTGIKLQNHFENWILKTRPRFKEMLRQIVQEKRKLGL